ncbi:asparagine synthase (glutamine-hydrolyzing) [Saccharopolyspora phatthalungensis]|uniref:asparagine synthase (glutamine-hydrolyzing) n=1 Tax=Saccharopolyspora phatthalungensis TaxID=664693 RepID=A0A840QKJ6_9PSEU|nr:asparagine synthase (glutamine-hydrolyzing) [Saccharopolyspora phatthalungensis]MBB5158983.1 asparagine synthase (glutamine-hydrolyzing) [Saccharopolyspora phatthalungensis]
MCGITGWVSYDSDLTQRRDILDEMTATLSDRGPDAAGTRVRPRAALGHRRLAVIDLPGGTQPMDSADGQVTLVYSGEVYNFTELRTELSGRGHRFRTGSDTEVVLAGYLEWGEAVAERLNGIFAFAVWDDRSQRLLLVRDRLGVKPLYYQLTRDGVLFGSEPKAILANPLARREVGLDCLHELLGQTKAPGWALWEDMREVEPGTVLMVSATGSRTWTYWRLETIEHTDDLDTTVATVRELLTDTVRRQLVAHVPQGVLLSGGLDSSALTGLAAEVLPRPRTFSVDFSGQEQEFRPDELRATADAGFVREVAAWVGSDHRAVVLDARQLTDPSLRRAVVGAWDIPLGLGDINTSLYLLFRAIRAESTVALSGESADEVFGGYPWFHHDAAVSADTFPWLAFSHAINTDRTAVLRKDLRDRLDIEGYVADQYSAAISAVDHLDGEDGLERRMRVICHLHLTRLVRALLDRKDRMSMATGLEVRVPFCDHRLVEYVYNTPWSMKNFDGREKSLLRAATRHLLPDSVVNRVKSPYPTVQDTSYVTALQRQVADVLAGDSGAFALVDAEWARRAVALDAAAVTGPVRQGMERVLDIHHWVDIHRPVFTF